MFNVLKDWLHKEPTTEEKQLAIRTAWIGFFEELDRRTGSVNIPAHERASKILEEFITENTIDEEYKRIKKLNLA